MRRIIAPIIVLTLVLSGLLAHRLRAQEAQLRGPSGGSGEIEGTEIRLAAKLSARVLEIKTTEGAAVRKGDLLVRLDCAEPDSMLAEAQARRAAAQAQALAARASADAAARAQRAAAASILATKAQAEALAAQRDAASRQAERLTVIGAYAAEHNRDQVQASAKGLGHQVEAALASSSASEAQAQAAAEQARAALANAEAAEAAIAAADAAVARAEMMRAECEVRAPRDAMVEQLPFEVGELVGPGMILVKLVDLGEVKATFYLPNAEIAAAKPGAEALVEADAYPGKPFRGVVRTVALRAEFTPRNIQTRTDRDRLVFPIEVVVPNPDLKLRPGMPVQVTLPGTER
ncbi:MAG: HlyD family secretion protein [Myxococcales bacterium]|jgi:HlyD family secretion protein